MNTPFIEKESENSWYLFIFSKYVISLDIKFNHFKLTLCYYSLLIKIFLSKLQEDILRTSHIPSGLVNRKIFYTFVITINGI